MADVKSDLINLIIVVVVDIVVTTTCESRERLEKRANPPKNNKLGGFGKSESSNNARNQRLVA